MMGDRLQQDFYQLNQEKGEKIKVFAGRLEQLYQKLQQKFPGKYDVKQLKDHLFYGMSQHLWDSMRFLYKKEETSYEDLLKASQEAEGEWTKNKSARVKNVTITKKDGLKALKEQISSLASAITVSQSLIKGKEPKMNGTQKGKRDQDGKLKTKGPETNGNRPFQEGQQPIQCFKCGGWGHMAHICPSQGNMNWRNLNGADAPPAQTGPVRPKKQ